MEISENLHTLIWIQNKTNVVLERKSLKPFFDRRLEHLIEVVVVLKTIF